MPSRPSLTAGSVAGVLTIASAILLVAAIAIGSTGGSVGLGSIGTPAPGGLLLLCAMVFGAAGLALVGFIGPRPLAGRFIRAGFLIAAVGMAGIAISSIVGATLTYDPLESWPVVISGLVGLIGLAIGVPLSVAAMLATRGAPRRLALLFVGGLAITIVSGNVVGNMLMRGAIHDDARVPFVVGTATLLIGVASILLAYAGIGWLAVVGDRRGEASAS